MSITINGATNTLTAASGLTVAGNTAVTGTLSATGVVTASTGLVWGASTYQGFLSYSGGNVVIGNLSTGLVNLAVNGTTMLSMSSVLTDSVKPFQISDTTDATSTTSASLKTAGGLGVVGSAYFGGRVNSALFRTTSGQVVCTATVQSGDLYTISRGATIFDINCYATGAALQTTALISSDGTNHTLTILKSGASTVLAIVGNAIRVTCASNVTLDWNALRIA